MNSSFNNDNISSYGLDVPYLVSSPLESLTQHETLITACLPEACAVTVPACYSIVTLNFDLLNPNLSAIILMHWCKFGKNPTTVILFKTCYQAQEVLFPAYFIPP